MPTRPLAAVNSKSIPDGDLSGLSVVVVGGGIGGLGTAAQFQSRGARVLVLERSPSRDLVDTAGVSLGPEAENVIAGLGIDLHEVCHYTTRTYHAAPGVLEPPERRGWKAKASWHLLHDALVDLVERGGDGEQGPSILRGSHAAVTRINRLGPRPSITLASKQTVEADLLVIATGSGLAGRELVSGAADFGAWKDDHPLLFHQPPVRKFAGAVAFRGVVPLAALRGLVEADLYREAVYSFYADPGCQIVFYPIPLKDGLAFSWDLILRVPLSGLKGLLGPLWTNVSDPLPPATIAWLPKVAEAVRLPPGLVTAMARTQHPYAVPIHYCNVTEAVVYRSAALIGDASHAIPPGRARGASNALEEASALARLVGVAVLHQYPIAWALTTFEIERMAIGEILQSQGRQSARRHGFGENEWQPVARQVPFGGHHL